MTNEISSSSSSFYGRAFPSVFRPSGIGTVTGFRSVSGFCGPVLGSGGFVFGSTGGGAFEVFVASGYYDLATPHYAAEYTFAHMGLHAALRNNLRIASYEAGHMMYIESGSLDKLKEDVATFIADTSGTAN